ncbi:MAG: hypothetical protein PHT01_06820 [Spirochaetales bacterium]|nr:hypothetical protein [Spirochaetales bacterium]HOI22846.1 hypothetical protein [Spirochaetales bacterium]
MISKHQESGSVKVLLALEIIIQVDERPVLPHDSPSGQEPRI